MPLNNLKKSSDLFKMVKERLMIFIDGGNLFHGAKSAKVNISHEKLVKFLSKDYHLIRTYYYTGVNHLKLRDKDKIRFLRNYHNFEIVQR